MAEIPVQVMPMSIATSNFPEDAAISSGIKFLRLYDLVGGDVDVVNTREESKPQVRSARKAERYLETGPDIMKRG